MGMMIMPMMMNDDNMLSVEPNTGYTTNIQQRTLQNFQVWNDTLINWANPPYYGQFIPLVFIDREGNFSQGQFSNYFSFIQDAKTSDTALFVILLVTGIILLLAGAFFIFKAITLGKAAAQNESDSSDRRNLINSV
jgi:hypothetical protein